MHGAVAAFGSREYHHLCLKCIAVGYSCCNVPRLTVMWAKGTVAIAAGPVQRGVPMNGSFASQLYNWRGPIQTPQSTTPSTGEATPQAKCFDMPRTSEVLRLIRHPRDPVPQCATRMVEGTPVGGGVQFSGWVQNVCPSLLLLWRPLPLPCQR